MARGVPMFVLLTALAECGGQPPPTPPLAQIPTAPPAPPPPPAPSVTAEVTTAAPKEARTVPCSPGEPIDVDDDQRVGGKVPGSFSGPGLDELFVERIACVGEGSEGFYGHGLLRRRDGVFRVVRAAEHGRAGTDLSACQALRTSEGRDLVVCRYDVLSHAGWSEESVIVYDCAANVDTPTIRLAGAEDTTRSTEQSDDVLVGKIEGVTLADVDRDGNKDVRVTLRQMKVHVTKRPPCPEPEGNFVSCPPPPNLPKAPLQTLEFLVRGAALTPTPATAKALKAIEAMRKP